jgi:hypothetical protein
LKNSMPRIRTDMNLQKQKSQLAELYIAQKNGFPVKFSNYNMSNF